MRDLAGESARLAAGRQHLHTRRCVQQFLRNRGTGVDQVLAVVQNDQAVLVGKHRHERVQGCATRLLAKIKCEDERLC